MDALVLGAWGRGYNERGSVGHMDVGRTSGTTYRGASQSSRLQCPISTPISTDVNEPYSSYARHELVLFVATVREITNFEVFVTALERVEECGWDQRLCLDDDEYAEYGAGILESYEEGRMQGSGDQDAMQVDGGVEDGVWWCRGKRKCQRHAGWQKLRALEFEFEQELKEKAMSALTSQEREIRKQLEDVISLQARKANMPTIGVPLQPLNGRAQPNGTVKSKSNGTGKKGKQKR
ncbi:hypothetical protein NUW54_g2474 [Trametes sanguinea]|uniref:Uncharacterized protein n=1 Tax=Trametes sanguinea TaxID=158606 RepID=A0ACC1Q5R6_9APHY|nr:hypothetical protein NUW54_g2474 [Trametes sanguinea]